jgi:hypothetical protein
MQGRLDQLRATLADLAAELRSIDTIDDATRHELETAALEIISLLHRSENLEPSASPETLKDRLLEFEASHPNLAAVVNRLIDMLGQMGI